MELFLGLLGVVSVSGAAIFVVSGLVKIAFRSFSVNKNIEKGVF